jgi:hypothetical protein
MPATGRSASLEPERMPPATALHSCMSAAFLDPHAQLLTAPACGATAGTWQVLYPRQQDVEYSASHRGDHLVITQRDAEHPNSQLFVAPLTDPSKRTLLLPHRCAALPGCAGSGAGCCHVCWRQVHVLAISLLAAVRACPACPRLMVLYEAYVGRHAACAASQARWCTPLQYNP